MPDINNRDPPPGYTLARPYDMEDDQQPRPRPQPRPRYKGANGIPKEASNKLILFEWKLEILSTLASVAIFAGIVAIFVHVDGKPLSDWPDAPSLYATISLLTTVASTALMHGVGEFISQNKWRHFKKGYQELKHFEAFDSASRGWFGSFKFFASGVGWNLAKIGAAITIARVAFAPLTQQVVKVEQRHVEIPQHNVTFGYTYSYDRNLPGLANHRAESIPQDPKIQSAIVQGLYDLDVPAPFACPGECAWNGTYMSLGFKSECTNVTQVALGSMICEKDPADATTFSNQCNMTTPAGLILSTRWHHTDLATNYCMNATFPEPTLGAVAVGSPLVARFAVYRATSDHNFGTSNVNITDCSLSLTAYEYTGARANGRDFHFIKTREVLDNETSWNLNRVAFRGRLATNESEERGLPGFEIAWTDLQAIQNFFISETFVNEWVDGNFRNENLGLAAALMGDVDLEHRFEKMATSMTDYVRSGPNSQTARGMRVESVPFVTIRWYWLLVPIAIEVAVVLFAVTTIMTNRRSRNIPMWKSSALAVLACDHDERSGTIRSPMRRIDDIEAVAADSKARLA